MPLKRDDRSFHGRPNRDRGKSPTSIGTKKPIKTPPKGGRK